MAAWVLRKQRVQMH